VAEKEGRPAVCVVSTAFELAAHVRARTLGMKDQPIVLVPHPVATRSVDEIRALADQLAPGIVLALTRR
jgi:hypothetical protein